MISIDTPLYRHLASMLAESITSLNYFNGTVEHQTEEYSCTLRSTLIVYRDAASTVCDVVPVWWEFSLVQQCGEVLTDFSWSDLREVLMEYI